MGSRFQNVRIFTATVIALLSAACASVPDEASDADERCVSLMAIDNTDVVSDYGILFYLRNGDIYLNKFPRRCPGLAFEDAFMYQTSVSQICELDTISVLDDRGFGLTAGMSCGLGGFYSVSEDEAEALRSGEQDIE